MAKVTHRIDIARQGLYPQQLALFAPDRVLAYLGCPQASGKSTAMLLWLYCQAQNAAGLYWYVSKTYADARDKFRRFVAAANSMDIPIRINKSTLEITLGNGAILSFRSGENPQALYGPTIHALVIDEASRISDDARTACESRLTMTGGPIRYGGNKDAQNWFIDYCESEGAIRMDADAAVTAGIMRPEDYDFWRGQFSELRWRELYLLEDVAGNTPFAAALRANADNAELPTDNAAIVYGIDIAKEADYWVICGINAAGQVVHFTRWTGKDYTQAVQDTAAIVGKTRCNVDATGVGNPVCDMLRREGVTLTRYTITGAPSSGYKVNRQDLLESLAVAMEQGKVTVYGQDVILQEMRQFEYITRANGVTYRVPEHLHDDSVFALALAWYSQRTRGAGRLLSIGGRK